MKYSSQSLPYWYLQKPHLHMGDSMQLSFSKYPPQTRYTEFIWTFLLKPWLGDRAPDHFL